MTEFVSVVATGEKQSRMGVFGRSEEPVCWVCEVFGTVTRFGCWGLFPLEKIHMAKGRVRHGPWRQTTVCKW